jgi:hypothetical protein
VTHHLVLRDNKAPIDYKLLDYQQKHMMYDVLDSRPRFECKNSWADHLISRGLG